MIAAAGRVRCALDRAAAEPGAPPMPITRAFREIERKFH
jgi:hypothetical protein